MYGNPNAARETHHQEIAGALRDFLGRKVASQGHRCIGRSETRLCPSTADCWGEPLRWHKLFGHSFRFHKSVLASPSRRRGLGKGTAFRNLFVDVVVHKMPVAKAS